VTAVANAFTEAHVEADGLRIRYLHGGTGRPLVWLHGGGGLQLKRAHELLAERYRLVAFEVPGFGPGAASDRSQTYPELAATLATAARQLGLERFNLWGTSVGSTLALWLTIGAPELIEALVLERPGAIQPATPAADPAALTEQHLAALTVPTLVVVGTRVRLTPPELGRVYRAKMPNCNYVLVYDAGHDVAADRPEAFSSLVGDFLERREAFIVSQKSSLLHP
jgi:pimeloyl-ACP methyl ester carboxylesterase